MQKKYDYVIAATAFIAPVIGVLAARGLAPLIVVAGALAGGLYRREEGIWPRPQMGFVIPLAVVFFWTGLGLFWSPSVSNSLATLGKLCILMGAGAVLVRIAESIPDADREFVRRAMFIGFVVGLVLLVVEARTGAFITQALRGLVGRGAMESLAGLNMAASATALMIWPALRAVPQKYSGFGSLALLLVAVGAVFLLESQTTKVALVAGAVVFGLARFIPNLVVRGLMALMVVGFLGAPIIPGFLPNPVAPGVIKLDPSFSLSHRIAIWKFTQERISERPTLGWGLDASRGFQEHYAEAYPERYRNSDTDQLLEAMPYYFRSQPLPLHPHNGVLQIWLELGVVGALSALALALIILRGIRLRPVRRADAAYGAALFVTAVLLLSSAFGIWQSWWVAALWLAGALGKAVIGDGNGAASDRVR